MRPHFRAGPRTSVLFGIFLLAGIAIPAPSTATPPQFSSLSPDGGEFLTGGTTFPIAWNVTHDGDARVYATITWGTGGATSSYFITAGVFSTGGAAYAWPVPKWNASDARVRVCVVTVDGSQGCRASSGAFAINATRPYVALLTPNDGASDVPLNVTMLIGFSDPADPSTILVSIAPAVPLVATWTGGDRFLFLRSTGPLNSCAMYVVTLQESGQPPRIWRFTTVCPVPPPKPPHLTRAGLSGPTLADLSITWTASSDEGLPGGTEEYLVLGPAGLGGFEQYAVVPATGAENYTYVCGGCGVQSLNSSSRFYKVRAVSATLGVADSNLAAVTSTTLTEGWNLLSPPLVLADWSVSNILQTLPWDVARTYRSSDSTDPWKSAYANRDGDLTALRFGDGLWVNVSASGVLWIAGLVATNPTFTLRPGWNLVGYASFARKSWGESVAAVPGVLAVEAYSSQGPSHLVRIDPGTLLMEGAAYWILVAPGGGGDWVQA